MDYKDLLEIGGVVVTVTTVVITTREQTRSLAKRIEDLYEAVRHHRDTEHPKLDDRLSEVQVEVAVVRDRTQSQLDREERRRR
jgi:hypothetical protein